MPHVDAKTAAATKDKAERLFSGGKWTEALGMYEKIRPYGAKDPRILLRMGDIARKLDEKGSIPYYKEAVESFAKLGFLIKAIAVCKMIIGIDPGEDEVQRMLAGLASAEKGQEGAVSRKGPLPPSPPAQPPLPVEEAEGVGEEERRKLPRVPLFSDFTEAEFLEVVRKVRVVSLREAEFLFREGDGGDAIYFIAEGAVDVLGRTRDGSDVPVAGLKEGDVFGEFGFFSRSKRSSGVRAGTDSTLLEITKKNLEEVIALHNRVEDVLFNFYKERVVDRLMALSSVFKPLSAGYRREVLKGLRPARFPKGTLIMREKEEGETMYLIKEGSVSVWVSDPSGGKKEIAPLKEGDLFGEIALATNKPRVANVTAETDVELVEFPRSVIRDIAERYPEVKDILSRVIKERVADLLGAMEERAKFL